MEKQVSTVGLKTYFIYDEYRPPAHVTIEQADFLLAEGVTLPRSGQTFLYGTRGTQHVLGRVLVNAHDANLDACIVDVRVDVGRWINRKQDFDTLDELKFFKFPDRTRASLMDDLNQRWRLLLDRHGLPQDDFPRHGSDHMHLLDEIIQQPPYDQLHVIGFPLRTVVGWTQAALVVNPQAITEVVPATAYDTQVTLETGPR